MTSTKLMIFIWIAVGNYSIFSPPKIGAVELTQTGSALYKKANCFYPIISVDDSLLKLLETMLGTGDGLLRALTCKFGHDIYDKKFIFIWIWKGW